MNEVWFYSIISVVIVSLVSLLGIFAISIKVESLKKFLIFMLAFSAGALFGDVAFHIIPEISEKGFNMLSSSMILGGVVLFFTIEKFIHWQHCHMPITKTHVHPFAYMNLVGDSFHNLIDGLIIGASYLVSLPLGLATTIAVILHEIPQEIGDFGVMLHGGFSKSKALWLNFFTALFAVLGTLIALIISSKVSEIADILLPLAAGGFIYIAGADLIPELHKETAIHKSLIQLISFLAGIGIMALLLLIG